MPREVSISDKLKLINLITEKDKAGLLRHSQREIEKISGFSRPYIRKIAREIGHQFPRNGVEIKGVLCVCANCGTMFRKHPSKVKRSARHFDSDVCREAFMKGPQHPSWKTGQSAKSFSEWVKNQSEYKEWRDTVLARAGFKCEISGRTENLEAHHLSEKSKDHAKAFDPDNGMCLNKEVHTRLHQLASQGKTFDESVEIIKKEVSGA